MANLDDKVAVITGAAGAIGRETVSVFRRSGTTGISAAYVTAEGDPAR